MKEEWLMPGAFVPVDANTTGALIAEIKRLIGVVGGMALNQQRTWVGLTDEEVMVAAYQAGFDIHEDYENEDDPEAMHWWTPDGEACDDSLLKLRDLIEAKLKEKNA